MWNNWKKIFNQCLALPLPEKNKYLFSDDQKEFQPNVKLKKKKKSVFRSIVITKRQSQNYCWKGKTIRQIYLNLIYFCYLRMSFIFFLVHWNQIWDLPWFNTVWVNIKNLNRREEITLWIKYIYASISVSTFIKISIYTLSPGL